MQRHELTEIVNYSRSTALEWSAKIYWMMVGVGGEAGRVVMGEGFNRLYVATTLALNSAVVSQDICLVRM